MLGAEIDLMPGEKMILASNPHWFYFWKQVAAGIVIVILLCIGWIVEPTGWVGTVLGWLIVISVILFLVNLAYEFVQWKTTRFAITDQRVAYQSGVIRRRGVSIPLNRINNVNFEQTMIARMLNNGIVTIESAGQSGDSVFENIPDPEHVRSTIFAEMAADEQRDSDRNATSLAQAMRDRVQAAPSDKTPQERLAHLEELRAQGLIDPTEYATKRQQILDDL